MLNSNDAIACNLDIFASNIGSEHLIGLAGAGAESGMGMAHWEIQGWMILILGWVFVPFYSRSLVTTMPEFLERRESKKIPGEKHQWGKSLKVVEDCDVVICLQIGMTAKPGLKSEGKNQKGVAENQNYK